MAIIQKPIQKRRSKNERAGLEGISTSCSRCGGMVVLSFCVSPEQGTWDFEIPVGRCLQCGDIVDQTILRNRRLTLHPHSIN